ncbi:MAG: hypothetical protein GY749_36200 [Desulfobacteraceae bacterium]|nr:hypothetical protein [Desulfobacteraceae bacterium]
MKKNEFVILTLRLLSIYFVVTGFSSISNVIPIIIASPQPFFSFIIGPFTLIICGFVLYIFAPGFSLFIIEFSNAEDDDFHITESEKTTRIALLILGFFIFAQALPQVIQASVEAGLYYKHINKIADSLREDQHKWTYLIGPFVNLIIGIVLIIGPDKLLTFLPRYDESFKKIKKALDQDTNNYRRL